MKAYFFVFSILVCFSSAFSQWDALPSVKGVNVTSFYKHNNDSLYVCTPSGVYFRNSSSNNWTLKFIDDFKKIRIVNGVTYGISQTNILFRLWSGGNVWNPIQNGVIDINSKNDTIFTISNSSGANKLYYSSDFGLSWLNITPATVPSVSSLEIVGNKVLIGHNANISVADASNLTIWNLWSGGLTAGLYKDFAVSNDSIYTLSSGGNIFRNDLNFTSNAWVNLNQNVSGTTVSEILYANDTLFFYQGKNVFYHDGILPMDTIQSVDINANIKAMVYFDGMEFYGNQFGVHQIGTFNQSYNQSFNNLPLSFSFTYKNKLFISNGSSLTMYFDENTDQWISTNYFGTNGVSKVVKKSTDSTYAFYNSTGVYLLQDSDSIFDNTPPTSLNLGTLQTGIRDLLSIGDTLLYAFSTGIMRSLNGGATWLNASVGIDVPNLVYKLHYSTNGQVFAYLEQNVATQITGYLYKSLNYGGSWSAFISNSYPSYKIVDSTIYRVFKTSIFAGYQKVEKSFDSGLTWENAELLFNNSPIDSCNQVPLYIDGYKPNQLFFFDDFVFLVGSGVYLSKSDSEFHNMKRGATSLEANEFYSNVLQIDDKFYLRTSKLNFFSRSALDFNFPSPSTNVTQESLSTTLRNYTWEDNELNESSYKLLYSATEPVQTIPANTESLSISSDTLLSNYFGPVGYGCNYIITNVDGDESYSDGVNYLNVSELDLASMVYLFPNPCSEGLTVIAKEEFKPISVLDINGRKQFVPFTKVDNLSFSGDVSKLSSGIYFLQIEYLNSNYLIKFVKD